MNRLNEILLTIKKYGAVAPSDQQQLATEVEQLLTAVKEFREKAGKHEGNHGPYYQVCSKCDASYVEAESRLDDIIKSVIEPNLTIMAPGEGFSDTDFTSIKLRDKVIGLETYIGELEAAIEQLNREKLRAGR